MRAATAHALDDGVERHIDLEHVVELDPGRLHGFGLGDGAGEAVKQETLGTVALGDAVLDQVDDEVVADQATGVHHLLGLQPQWGAGLDGGAQHVTRGNLRDAVLLANEVGLGAFAGAGGAQQNESHGLVLIAWEWSWSGRA